MQPNSEEEISVGLWEKTYQDKKTGKDKRYFSGSHNGLQYTIFPNEFRTEEKHPHARMKIKAKQATPAFKQDLQQPMRQPNAHRPHTEEDLPF